MFFLIKEHAHVGQELGTHVGRDGRPGIDRGAFGAAGAGGHGYTISGTTLTLGVGGVDASAVIGTTTVSSDLTLLAGSQQWKAGYFGTLAVNGAVTRNTGATVDFSATGITSSSLGNTYDILGAWAITGTAVSSNSTGDWVAKDDSGNIIPYAGYTNITAATAPVSTQNWKATNAASAISAAGTINSLVVTEDFTVNAGVTMTLGSGGLILRGPSKWLKAGNATTSFITSGLSTGELFVYTPNATGNGNDWRIWPIIANGSSATRLIKDGPGYVKLEGVNTYTGGTWINAGT